MELVAKLGLTRNAHDGAETRRNSHYKDLGDTLAKPSSTPLSQEPLDRCGTRLPIRRLISGRVDLDLPQIFDLQNWRVSRSSAS